MRRLDKSRLDEAARSLYRQRSRVALVAVAHADDAEIRFGATMLRLIDAGWRVHILVATKGQCSCVDAKLPEAALVALRRAEQRQAARLAGVSGVIFLDFPDGDLESFKRPLQERIVYHLRRLRPQCLYTYDPTTVYFSKKDYHLTGPINHPDHRAVGDAALSAVYCGSPLARSFPQHGGKEGLLPWAVEEVFLAASARPNFRVNDRPYLARKRRLISVYRSQSGSTVQMTALRTAERTFLRLDCRPPSAIMRLLD
jgi:LmbE family N-acetylglucosaminyl deacetylase